MAFGIWALLVGEIGLAGSVVTATSLGIIVDATVHFLSKYRRARTLLKMPIRGGRRSLRFFNSRYGLMGYHSHSRHGLCRALTIDFRGQCCSRSANRDSVRSRQSLQTFCYCQHCCYGWTGNSKKPSHMNSSLQSEEICVFSFHSL